MGDMPVSCLIAALNPSEDSLIRCHIPIASVEVSNRCAVLSGIVLTRVGSETSDF